MDKPEKLSEQYGDFNHFHSTDYDHFFDKRIRNRGLSYYTNSKVENLICNNNTYSADVIGTESYQVRIKIENSVLTEISCTCPYHKETSKYCKHVYALLLTIQMQARRVDMIECIHQYTRNILDLVKEMDTTVKNNGKTLYPYEIEWFHKRQISYQETIKSSPKEYEQLKDFELFKVFKELNFSFHMLYDDFTELNERIKNNQQEIEMRRQEQQNPKIDTFTYTVDDS